MKTKKKKKCKTKITKLSSPTWYLVNGMTVREVKSWGAKVIEVGIFKEGNYEHIQWKPIFTDIKRNIIIAIREE